MCESNKTLTTIYTHLMKDLVFTPLKIRNVLQKTANQQRQTISKHFMSH